MYISVSSSFLPPLSPKYPITYSSLISSRQIKPLNVKNKNNLEGNVEKYLYDLLVVKISLFFILIFFFID